MRPQRARKQAAQVHVDRTPQHSNPQAERAVLGAFLIDPAQVDAYIDRLIPQDFENHDHRDLFAAIQALHADGKPVDMVAVNDIMQRTGTLTDGGLLVKDLVDTCGNTALTAHYVEIVLQNSVARQKQNIGIDLFYEKIDSFQAKERLDANDARLDTQAAAPDTMEDLMGEELPARRWVVPGIIPEGLTVLGAKMKIGKSWMAYGLGIAVGTGGMFLGRQVEQGEALYLALEDGKQTLQDRGRTLLAGSRAPRALHLRTEWPRLDQGGMTQLDRWLRAHPACRLVIIDVLQRVRPPRTKWADPYMEDYAVIGELKAIADTYHVALVLIHHTRKAAAEDINEELHGSVALGGAADTLLVLTRKRGEREAELHLTGREVKDETALHLRFDAQTCAWQVLTDDELAREREQSMRQERRTVLDALTAAGRSMSPHDIGVALGYKDDDTPDSRNKFTALRVLLGKMVREKQIAQPAYGVYAAIAREVTPIQQLHQLQSASEAGSDGVIDEDREQLQFEEWLHLPLTDDDAAADMAEATVTDHATVTDTLSERLHLASPGSMGTVTAVTAVSETFALAHMNGHRAIGQTGAVCRYPSHETDWFERPPEHGGGWVCGICHQRVPVTKPATAKGA